MYLLWLAAPDNQFPHHQRIIEVVCRSWPLGFDLSSTLSVAKIAAIVVVDQWLCGQSYSFSG